MIATTHPVSPEELMAFADGELSGTEAAAVAAHITGCPECAGLAAQLAATSTAFAKWTVPSAPPSLDASIEAVVAGASGANETTAHHTFHRRHWTVARLSAVTAVLLLVVVGVTMRYRSRSLDSSNKAKVIDGSSLIDPGNSTADSASQPLPAPQAPPTEPYSGDAILADRPAPPAQGAIAGNYSQTNDRARQADTLESKSNGLAARIVPIPPSVLVPMIEHSVSLTVEVRDLSAARTELDALLARHRGYAEQLMANTAEGSPRSMQSSLRVPDAELAASLADMRALGRVEIENQLGEEVTQQHADLVARLQNSRETEQRLRELLAQHTGKIDDVLRVEEEISRVREEIERMEADQKIIEHRVDFATINLQLTEQYREMLGGQSASAPMQIRNAFVAGLRHGADTLLGILLFIEEAGPTVLIWIAILAVPGFLLWRRYRRIRARV